VLSYFKNLFGCQENRDLIAKVNDFFTHVQEMNTFVRICRSTLRLDQSVALPLVLETAKQILQQHA
jgi:hypothetical protein